MMKNPPEPTEEQRAYLKKIIKKRLAQFQPIKPRQKHTFLVQNYEKSLSVIHEQSLDCRRANCSKRYSFQELDELYAVLGSFINEKSPIKSHVASIEFVVNKNLLTKGYCDSLHAMFKTQ